MKFKVWPLEPLLIMFSSRFWRVSTLARAAFSTAPMQRLVTVSIWPSKNLRLSTVEMLRIWPAWSAAIFSLTPRCISWISVLMRWLLARGTTRSEMPTEKPDRTSQSQMSFWVLSRNMATMLGPPSLKMVRMRPRAGSLNALVVRMPVFRRPPAMRMWWSSLLNPSSSGFLSRYIESETVGGMMVDRSSLPE